MRDGDKRHLDVLITADLTRAFENDAGYVDPFQWTVGVEYNANRIPRAPIIALLKFAQTASHGLTNCV